LTAGLVTALVAASLSAVGMSRADAVEVYPVPANGIWNITGHGNGHGHGLSQYGARGAASRGLTAAQIIAFYYPGTVLARPAETMVRVLLSGSTGEVDVEASSGMMLSWPGATVALPVIAGADRWRLVPEGAGLALQYHGAAGWLTQRHSLPAQADIAHGGSIVYFGANGARGYRGSVGAVRSGASLLPINRLPLDAYTLGVVPMEMPTSWEPAAVQAQAIAARTYARYAVEHNGASPYDVCDTTQCQVYGGLSGEQAASNVAVNATAQTVVSYAGRSAFTQFSSDNGGWTTDGGQPYLVAKADPYAQYSGSPWFTWTRSVSAVDVAAQYGLRAITQIRILSRDGHGEWGGRILTAAVDGVATDGSTASIPTTGYGLTSALGLPHQWFVLQVSAPSAPTSLTAVVRDGGATVAWGQPASPGTSPLTGFSITAAGIARRVVSANARAEWVFGLANDVDTVITVRAINKVGESPPASIVVHPRSAPAGVVALAPSRLLDTRRGAGTLSPTRPMDLVVPGRGGVPTTGADSAMLSVAVVNPTAEGSLRAYTPGADAPTTSAFHYKPGSANVFTVAVSLKPVGRVRFAVTAGTAQLIVDQLGYVAAGAPGVTPVTPRTLARVATVATGPGTPLRVRGAAGVPASATGAWVQVTLGSSTNTPAAVQLYPSGIAPPSGTQLKVGALSRATATFPVPIGADGLIRIASSTPGISAAVVLIAYIAPPTAGSTAMEIQHVRPVADSVAGPPLLVGPAGRWFAIAGFAGVPASASAVLLHLTVRPTTSGVLWLSPAGGTAEQGVVVPYLAGQPNTVTVLVRPGVHGGLTIRTTSGVAAIGLAASGYLTTG